MSNSSELFKFVNFRNPLSNNVIDLTDKPFPEVDIFNKLKKDNFNFNNKLSSAVRSYTTNNTANILALDKLKKLSIYTHAIELNKTLSGENNKPVNEIIQNFPNIQKSDTSEIIKQIIFSIIVLKIKLQYEENISESRNEEISHFELVIKVIKLIYLYNSNKITKNIFTLSNYMTSSVIKFPKEWLEYELVENSKPSDNFFNSHWKSKYDLLKDLKKDIANIQMSLNKVQAFKNEVDKICLEKPELLITKTLTKTRTTKSVNRTTKTVTPIQKVKINYTNNPQLSSGFKVELDKRLAKSKLKVGKNLTDNFLVKNLSKFELETNIENTEEELNNQLDEINDKIFSLGLMPIMHLAEATYQPMLPRPAVKSLGFGDLFVVKERLKRYEATEISHIENILPGESKIRDHEVFNETEVIETLEKSYESEETSDLQTSERFELKDASEKILKDDFKVTAGVSLSASYGAVDLKATTNISDSSSKYSSNSQSVTKAKSITNRATSIIKETTKKSIRNRNLKRIIEKNSHSFTGKSEPISGIYKWVDKIQEVELRHYGERLMLEVMIPEPGAYYLSEKEISIGEKKEEFDLEFDLTPNSIRGKNYRRYTQLYKAVNVPTIPDKKISVGFSWSTRPNENANEHHQDNFDSYIKIPKGYKPVKAYIDCCGYGEADKDDISFHIAINGQCMLDSDENIDTKDFSIKLPTDNNGLPVTIRVNNHFDATATVNISVICRRSNNLYNQWQMEVYQCLREGYERLKRVYDEQTTSYYTYSLGDTLDNFSSSVHKQRELEEIKKMSIMTMRNGKPFNFNGLWVSDFGVRINNLAVPTQSKIVKFFEDSFEWDQCYYSLYPYYWGNFEDWTRKNTMTINDSSHLTFLRSGMAKVIIPVTPGFEEKVLHYIETPETDRYTEIHKINWQPDGLTSPTSGNSELWTELLLRRRKDIVIGNSTLKVTQNSKTVTINDFGWQPDSRDIEREIYIGGDLFIIKSIIDDYTFELNRPYPYESSEEANFVIGSVLIGVPWEEKIPTNLIVLSKNKDNLN